MLNEIKWGELGQKGIWVPRHDLTPVCILDWSIILKQWVMRQSGGSVHSLCKAIKCCHAQLLKGMGSVKCILLSTGFKKGSCEGREELQTGVRRSPQGTSASSQRHTASCNTLQAALWKAALALLCPLGKYSLLSARALQEGGQVLLFSNGADHPPLHCNRQFNTEKA